MPLTLESTRFGSVEIPNDAVIEFPAGLIGLGGSRFALVAREADASFVWLHSLDDPTLAVPVCNPWKFFDAFAVEISDEEAARIGIENAQAADVYVTVRAADKLEDFTANLRAPILVTEGRGYQVLNEAEEAPLRAPLFGALTGAEAA